MPIPITEIKNLEFIKDTPILDYFSIIPSDEDIILIDPAGTAFQNDSTNRYTGGGLSRMIYEYFNIMGTEHSYGKLNAGQALLNETVFKEKNNKNVRIIHAVGPNINENFFDLLNKTIQSIENIINSNFKDKKICLLLPLISGGIFKPKNIPLEKYVEEYIKMVISNFYNHKNINVKMFFYSHVEREALTEALKNLNMVRIFKNIINEYKPPSTTSKTTPPPPPPKDIPPETPLSPTPSTDTPSTPLKVPTPPEASSSLSGTSPSGKPSSDTPSFEKPPTSTPLKVLIPPEASSTPSGTSPSGKPSFDTPSFEKPPPSTPSGTSPSKAPPSPSKAPPSPSKAPPSPSNDTPPSKTTPKVPLTPSGTTPPQLTSSSPQPTSDSPPQPSKDSPLISVSNMKNESKDIEIIEVVKNECEKVVILKDTESSLPLVKKLLDDTSIKKYDMNNGNMMLILDKDNPNYKNINSDNITKTISKNGNKFNDKDVKTIERYI